MQKSSTNTGNGAILFITYTEVICKDHSSMTGLAMLSQDPDPVRTAVLPIPVGPNLGAPPALDKGITPSGN